MNSGCWGVALRAVAVFGMSPLGGCVVEKVPAPAGLGGFHVEILSVTPAESFGGACAGTPATGSQVCPLPFPDASGVRTVRLRVTALDAMDAPLATYVGRPLVDVRPGRIEGADATGWGMQLEGGVGEIDVPLLHAYGETRIWIEDCGSPSRPGTFASGVSPSLFFDLPTLTDINVTTDNVVSPLMPQATNVCVISGDSRYGIEGSPSAEFVGYSQGRQVNAPPPRIGNYLEVVGCTRAQHLAGVCTRGPLVVTAIDNGGFYVTDINPSAQAAGFGHIFVFNFNYPDNLELGDVLISLRGAPVEFSGSTQLSNPSWNIDAMSRYRDLLPAGLAPSDCLAVPSDSMPAGCPTSLLPKPIRIDAADYASALRTYGRNKSDPDDAGSLVLERLEGALVCMDNLAPAAVARNCDVNGSGNIERRGCLWGGALPQRCDESMGEARSGCASAPQLPGCLPLTAEELDACGLRGYLPQNPAEYCCERICYDDLACVEKSSYEIYGQWTADVFGRYESDGGAVVKVAVVSRDAAPNFDPLVLGAAERAVANDAARQRVAVIGNLRHVIAARPAWVIIARSPADIRVGETCD